MTDEKLPPEEENKDPDTDTGDEGVEGGEDYSVPKAVPVAGPSAASELDAAPAPPPPAPAAPRVFPQQYTLLFASTCMLAGALTVWERQSVTGNPDMYGFQMIGGGLVFAWALYCVITGLVGLIRGGVRFGAPLLTAFFAIYFAIRSILRLTRLDGFEYYGDLKQNLGLQEGLNTFLGQLGPGIWLELFGGLVIFWLFFKAMFFGKKKEEPAPARGGRGGRRR